MEWINSFRWGMDGTSQSTATGLSMEKTARSHNAAPAPRAAERLQLRDRTAAQPGGSMIELPPQLRLLHDFYYKTALTLPAGADMAYAPGLIDRPAFFTLEHLQRHLNNPLLMPGWFALFWQGKRVDCTPAVGHRIIQSVEVPFLNKGIIQDYLSHGAALVLEGIDFLEPGINAMCKAIDAAHPCVMSNVEVFFSQHGQEAYRGHLDTDDVLVIHLHGQKKWRIHERQAPRRVNLDELTPDKMGGLQAEIVMNPGDALFLKSGVPHRVETTGACSLHMSFDICDRIVNAETALHLLIQEFDRDATRAYTPVEGVVEKLMQHARSPEYWKRVREMQASQTENYRNARLMIGGNRVTHLDQLLGVEKRVSL
ncbi:MAG: hypothetical protein KIT18_04715 [Burkholderiales bacterium]|nr:hypothetical protein [Burkholderiales bacterium]